MSKDKIEIEEEVHYEDTHFGTFLLIFILIGVLGMIILMVFMNDNRTIDKNKKTTTTTNALDFSLSTSANSEIKKNTTTIKPTYTIKIKEREKNRYRLDNGIEVEVIKMLQDNGTSTVPRFELRIDGKLAYSRLSNINLISKKDIYSINETDFVIGIVAEMESNTKDYILIYDNGKKNLSLRSLLKLPVLENLSYEDGRFMITSTRGKIDIEEECLKNKADTIYQVTEEFVYSGNGKFLDGSEVERKTLRDIALENNFNNCE